MVIINLNKVSSNYHELELGKKKIKKIQAEKYKLLAEIKKYESYYTKETKFEKWEIDCFITNIALDYDNLSLEESKLSNKLENLEKEIDMFVAKILNL